jgi:hypothetical protein
MPRTFQATFLVLVSKAAALRNHDAVAKWLYGVAHQTAVGVRATLAKQYRCERQVTDDRDRAEPPYGNRRRMDFFVRNLLGVEPRTK